MNYEREILKVLYEAGDSGLSVHKIAIHVHNAQNTLFAPIEFEEVRRDVQMWLLRNSRLSYSPVVRLNKRGLYGFNMQSANAQQMILQFADDADAPMSTTAKDNNKTKSPLSLFDL